MRKKDIPAGYFEVKFNGKPLVKKQVMNYLADKLSEIYVIDRYGVSIIGNLIESKHGLHGIYRVVNDNLDFNEIKNLSEIEKVLVKEKDFLKIKEIMEY